jgi:NAD-dependent protein deacetylase/lipoamidase
MTEKDLALAAGWIKNSRHTIALTGAGVSVDSGIPDFRSPGGLWSKYNPMEYAAIETFRSDPAKVWTMLTEMIDVLTTAIPNAGHKGLTDLESMGLLQGIVTQNIDNLHQFAGAKKVIEYHGNASSFTCMMCGESYEAESFRSKYEQGVNWPPKCGKCDHFLKPDIIFFGEAIPPEAAKESHDLALKSDLMLVVGTSAEVYPAAGLPAITRANGGRVIEINRMQTRLSGHGADLSLIGSSTQIIPRMVSMLSEQ